MNPYRFALGIFTISIIALCTSFTNFKRSNILAKDLTQAHEQANQLVLDFVSNQQQLYLISLMHVALEFLQMSINL